MEQIKDGDLAIVIGTLTAIAGIITSVIRLRRVLTEPSRVVQQIQRDLDQLLDFIEDDLVRREQDSITMHRLKSIEKMRQRLRHIDGVKD